MGTVKSLTEYGQLKINMTHLFIYLKSFSLRIDLTQKSTFRIALIHQISNSYNILLYNLTSEKRPKKNLLSFFQ